MEMLYNAYENAQHVAGKIHNATGMPVLAFETTPEDVPPPPRKERDREEDARLRKEKFPGLSSMPVLTFSLIPRKEKVLEDDLGRVMMGLCWNLEIELVPSVPALPKLQLCRRSRSDSDCCMLMSKFNFEQVLCFNLGDRVGDRMGRIEDDDGWCGDTYNIVDGCWLVIDCCQK